MPIDHDVSTLDEYQRALDAGYHPPIATSGALGPLVRDPADSGHWIADDLPACLAALGEATRLGT